MQIWKIMFCELLIFTITISRYGFSTYMYTIFKLSLGLKITNIKISGNIVERLWHINNVTSYEDFQLKM